MLSIYFDAFELFICNISEIVFVRGIDACGCRVFISYIHFVQATFHWMFYVNVKTFQTQDKKYFLGLLSNSLSGSSAYFNSFCFQGRLRSTVLNILPVAGSYWNICHYVYRHCRQLRNRLFKHVYFIISLKEHASVRKSGYTCTAKTLMFLTGAHVATCHTR